MGPTVSAKKRLPELGIQNPERPFCRGRIQALHTIFMPITHSTNLSCQASWPNSSRHTSWYFLLATLSSKTTYGSTFCRISKWHGLHACLRLCQPHLQTFTVHRRTSWKSEPKFTNLDYQLMQTRSSSPCWKFPC